ncbi:MAG: four helix bundle protein [Bacteroidota bacterium]
MNIIGIHYGTFKTFEDIDSWKNARELTNKIYKISNQNFFIKDFGLKDQIRKASVSVMSNIAEGFERGGSKEFIQFFIYCQRFAGGSEKSVICCIRSSLY